MAANDGLLLGVGICVAEVVIVGVEVEAGGELGSLVRVGDAVSVDPASFAGLDVIAVPEDEPHAANALLVGDTVIVPGSFPGTASSLTRHGFSVQTLDVSELQKAEAGLTCCSIIPGG